MPGRKAPEATRRQDIMRAAYVVAARGGVTAITVRAVAERAGVSHGTVLFHFKRRDELVATLLGRVLNRTADLRVADEVSTLPRPSDRLLAVMRAEMERLSSEPRHFRLFLEYWTLGVRNAPIRRRLKAALEKYRADFRVLAEAVVQGGSPQDNGRVGGNDTRPTAEGLAALAVSLIHGCALHSLIDPKGFATRDHLDAAARLLESIDASPYAR
jgi:AcrR family transcriptional regulator